VTSLGSSVRQLWKRCGKPAADRSPAPSRAAAPSHPPYGDGGCGAGFRPGPQALALLLRLCGKHDEQPSWSGDALAVSAFRGTGSRSSSCRAAGWWKGLARAGATAGMAATGWSSSA